MEKFDSDVRSNQLAIDFGVSESAIFQIEKQRENSFQQATRKTLHKPEYEDFKAKIHDCFLNWRERNAKWWVASKIQMSLWEAIHLSLWWNTIKLHVNYVGICEWISSKMEQMQPGLANLHVFRGWDVIYVENCNLRNLHEFSTCKCRIL